MISATVGGGEIVFSLSQIAQFLLVAFSVGGLYTQVRTHGTRLDKFEEHNRESLSDMSKRQERLEEKFLKAVEDLGHSFTILSTELKTVLAAHEVRLDHVEREK